MTWIDIMSVLPFYIQVNWQILYGLQCTWFGLLAVQYFVKFKISLILFSCHNLKSVDFNRNYDISELSKDFKKQYIIPTGDQIGKSLQNV